MPKATEILRKEHDAILHMLDAAERAAARLDRGEAVKPETLSGVLEFLRQFADKCHHGKEEDALFPLLEAKGVPRHGGPIGVMLSEHDEGRALMREMDVAVNALRAGDPAAGARWAGAARGYVGLLREHIFKENNILFMMAERLLTEDEQEQLARTFDRIETEKMGAGTHERLHAEMDRLLAELAPAPAAR